MKLYCLWVAFRNSGTRQNITTRGALCFRAKSCAHKSAQLSLVRWSRLIQYATGPFSTLPSLRVLSLFLFKGNINAFQILISRRAFTLTRLPEFHYNEFKIFFQGSFSKTQTMLSCNRRAFQVFVKVQENID